MLSPNQKLSQCLFPQRILWIENLSRKHRWWYNYTVKSLQWDTANCYLVMEWKGDSLLLEFRKWGCYDPREWILLTMWDRLVRSYTIFFSASRNKRLPQSTAFHSAYVLEWVWWNSARSCVICKMARRGCNVGAFGWHSFAWGYFTHRKNSEQYLSLGLRLIDYCAWTIQQELRRRLHFLKLIKTMKAQFICIKTATKVERLMLFWSSI